MSGRKPWQWIALGCGGIVVLTIATAAFFTFLYWPRLTAVYQQAKTGMSEMMHVSDVLQRQYGGHVAISANRRSGVPGMTLHISLTNPTFLDQNDPGDEALKQKAFEVAATAHGVAGQIRFDHYEIEFIRESGSGVTSARTWTYSFNASELPPARNKI